MKYAHVLFALMANCSALLAADSTTNFLSIHLVADNVSAWFDSANIPKLADLHPLSPPLLADDDFVSFDVKVKKFKVTPQAALRVAKQIADLLKKQNPNSSSDYMMTPHGDYLVVPAPVGFVLKASGVPMYSGVFYCLHSSRLFDGPTILCDSMAIPPNLTATVQFSIYSGYPPGVGGVAQKLRDPRIDRAVEKMFASRAEKNGGTDGAHRARDQAR